MIHLYSGNGKGKTTAAVGLTVRALGAGKVVLFAQFLKGSLSSEVEVLKEQKDCLIFRNTKDLGFYANLSKEEKEEMKRMHDATIKSLTLLVTNRDDIFMLVLDEVTYVFEQGICSDLSSIKRLIDLAMERNIEIVITGRNPQVWIKSLADYHTEFNPIKHPFDKGVSARIGIEY